MLLLEHTCTIKRTQPVGTNGRMDMATHASNVPCLVLPMAPAASVQNGFTIGQGYDVYFSDGQDVQVNDKLTFGGQSYLVKGVRPYQVPVIGYVHAMCTREAG